MIVRNPYTRLLSTYREKFGGDNKMFNDAYGKYIIKTYRKNAANRLIREYVDNGV